MRLARVSLLVSLCLLPLGLQAAELQDVSAIQAAIKAKQGEYAQFSKSLDRALQEQSQLQQQLDLLRARSRKLEVEKKQTLDAMNAAYAQMIQDPTLNIADAQSRYQQSVEALQRNESDLSQQQAAIKIKLNQVEQGRLQKHALLNTLESLKEQLNKARVERLQAEFTREAQIDITNNVSCQRTETFASCEARSKQLAQQKASQRFLDQVFNNLTEAQLVAPKRAQADAKVQVLSSNVINEGFSGKGDYFANMSYQMRGQVNRKLLCGLLELDDRYCINGADLGQYQENVIYTDAKAATTDILPSSFNSAALDNTAKITEVVMHQLTIRSNVRDDQVFIDGVPYGSTRVDVMLPAGPHKVEVRKAGYQTATESVYLTANNTLKVELKKGQAEVSEGLAANFNPAKTVSDSAANTFEAAPVVAPSTPTVLADKIGPSLVNIPVGSFTMGDLTGNGLANERPVRQHRFDSSFSISDKEITVAEFEAFVKATGHVTVAEKGEGCAFYQNGQPVYEKNLNWRNPGFEQASNHPVVCVTQTDAKAYTQWLSQSSNSQYRLPNELEWEYAARAQTETDYWWDNTIGTNRANCGWCGSQWSNVSTSPVASFVANKFGLYDTVGNVWEWTDSQEQTDVVVRGGAWNFAPSLARASTRLLLAQDFRANYLGFRVVRTQ